MSKGGGGGGAARLVIPENVRKTIQDIREITGKLHSEEDIYTVLKDCSMDPNDTAQKLLYLDTFHEVKRKHDRRKEMPSTRGRGATSTLARGARGGRGNYSANYTSTDALGGRTSASQRENGVNHVSKRSPSTSLRTANSTSNKEAIPLTKASTIIANGPSDSHNGRSTLGHDLQLPRGAVISVTKFSSVVEGKKQENGSLFRAEQGQSSSSNRFSTSAATASVLSSVHSSGSDPILVPSMTWNPGAADAIKCEVGSQRKAEQNHSETNSHVSNDVESGLPNNEKAASGSVNSVNKKKTSGKSKAAEKNHLSEPLRHSPLPTDDGSMDIRSSSCESPSLEGSVISSEVVSSEDAQAKVRSQSPSEPAPSNMHVRFPNHFIVPEALKSGLTFGSFDANPGLGTKNSNDNGDDNNSTCVIESSHGGETVGEPSYSSESDSAIARADLSDKSESPQDEFVLVTQSEGNVKADSEVNRPKQETTMFPEGHQNPTAQLAPNYGFGIMPPMQGGHVVQFDGHESRPQDASRVSTFVGENPTASCSPSPPVQNSIAASPHPVIFRPTFPPNYLQCGPYFNPIYLPPMLQFLSHNGLPQQPSTSNAYIPPAPATARGFKVPHSQFKPGATVGNPTPIGLSPFYGSYGSSPFGFNLGPVVTSGSSTGNEDLSLSQLKESHVYTTGPLGEFSAWISPQGQDISSLQLNSLYHLHSQGQHLAFSPQAGHGPFAGIYPSVQTMAAPSTVNPVLQHSQALSAAVETVGPPYGAYQQPQLAQVNWNNSY